MTGTGPRTPADARAAFARSWDQASVQEAEVEQAPIPTPPGFVAWRIVGTRGVTVLPALLPHPPPQVWRRYHMRIVSNLTGVCPVCAQVAWINADPERTPAGWAKLDVTIGIRHSPACSAVIGEADRRFYDPRAVEQR